MQVQRSRGSYKDDLSADFLHLLFCHAERFEIHVHSHNVGTCIMQSRHPVLRELRKLTFLGKHNRTELAERAARTGDQDRLPCKAGTSGAFRCWLCRHLLSVCVYWRGRFSRARHSIPGNLCPLSVSVRPVRPSFQNLVKFDFTRTHKIDVRTR